MLERTTIDQDVTLAGFIAPAAIKQRHYAVAIISTGTPTAQAWRSS